MFDTLENPFEYMNSEHKRFQALSSSGCYIPPVKFEMGHVDAYEKSPDGTLVLVQKLVYGQMVPLRHVLKKFLELPGMLDNINEYVNALHDGKIMNFVQGELWSDLRVKFDQEGKFVLPIHLEYDDYGPDNALGSHRTDHSTGALYASIPCLPPELQSCLGNMFLFTTFESKFRKKFGNRMAFACSINEIKFLEESGVLVNVDGRVLNVYFCCSLIIADNLRYNVILGFVPVFTGNFYCRICKLHRSVMQHQCTAVPVNKLRNIVNYDQDVAQHDSYNTGVVEECVWNEMPSFHCTVNSNCDVMHDIFEGMLKYDVCQILFYLISVRNYFDVELLKERIEGFDYGPNDKGNKPPTTNLTLSCLQNCSWNLYASEMLCCTRYLGEIVGDLVPEKNRVWKLYLIIREIVDIVTAPYFQDGVDIYLGALVQEHHELYLLFFGTLKQNTTL
ncbi:hypothetical protein ONE63_003443 [Megalurothrips usitatus]|uniref:Uncharacterized protein n=1 Tax=Megalurothrips usitatus TaxID=439358 RepID=A0AAV7XA93_9NEOP|nr:hypothetical protein ONE63_003443 [Megalurothrips usitatus]